MKRSVILLPGFDNIGTVAGIREKYDPLVHCIAPHITLVFPFESELPLETLKAHIQTALSGVKRFGVLLQGITGDFRDGYLFLNVKRGNDQIIALHDTLYGGILEQFLSRKITYCPHLTVGRLLDPLAFDRAVSALCRFGESFETVIGKVYVEKTGADGKSVVECSFELK